MKRFSRKVLFAAVAVALVVSMLGCASAKSAAAGQGASGIVSYLAERKGSLPPMMGVEAAVDMALKGHEANGGSTTHFRWGDLSGQPLYVVSLFPDLGVIKRGKAISAAELTAFAKTHLQLFADPRVCLGTWFNEADGNTYIDINVVLADKATAVELAKRYNQIAIFDLATFEETATGGDGKPLADLPKPESRLPAFK